MADNKDLIRFLAAQNQVYLKALSEVRKGSKTTHWMWFIFPQVKGLGTSENARYFGIRDMQEAIAYLHHPILGKHLVEISLALLNVNGRTSLQIFGPTDNLKLRSCMTLFSNVENADPVFGLVLEKYFDGAVDRKTLELLNQQL